MIGVKLHWVHVAAGLSLLAVRAADAQNEVILKRKWVERQADLATVSAPMIVHHTHTKPNSISKSGQDGDMHFSGESSAIGLPFVAEIVNAKLLGQKAAVAALQVKAGTNTPLAITGAWRLWFEHPAKKQTQGGNNAFHPDNTNPDHSFEIHPVSRIDQHDIRGSFVHVEKYTAFTAGQAFPVYDKAMMEIKASTSGITLRAKKVGFNYVGFDIELTQKPKKVADGFIALARVLDGQGDEEMATGVRRMIFVEGTPAAATIAGAKKGDRFEILGIPRINLNAVLALVAKHGTKTITAPLQYEMIVVGAK
jgi:hypothetical protein